jgi:SAM-dependent methyltransferase
MCDLRQELSYRYIAGSGIEIGALHGPLPVSSRATVKYVDRLNVTELRKHYPELDHVNLVPVDIIDDGESLSSFKDESLDFIIANHMLEHCENPIGTLRSHFLKLRPGAIAYYAVPDKNFTFDLPRPLTTFEHLLLDDSLGPGCSKKQHFMEWVRFVNKKNEEESITQFEYLMNINYSIHYHVWNSDTFHDFIIQANRCLGDIFTVDEFVLNGQEAICILRKRKKACSKEDSYIFGSSLHRTLARMIQSIRNKLSISRSVFCYLVAHGNSP